MQAIVKNNWNLTLYNIDDVKMNECLMPDCYFSCLYDEKSNLHFVIMCLFIMFFLMYVFYFYL